MKTSTIFTLTLGSLLLQPLAFGQQKEPQGGGAAPAASPTTPASKDVPLGHGYVKRDGAIHFIGGGVTGTGANATRIDMPSPALLRKVVMSQFGPFKTAEGLDVASFEVLSEQYTRDKNRVYSKVVSNGEFIVIVLTDADPASFEVLGSAVTRDKNHVWYFDVIQKEADPATIQLVNGGWGVYKDKDSVHYQHTVIAGADVASFRHLASGYYVDTKRAYWCTTPIPNADPATFQVLGDSFIAKDSSRIYRSGEHLPGYDVATFEMILHAEAGYQFLSDKNGIHLNKMTFPRSKPGKVEIIDNKTVKAGDLIHLVNTYQNTPVTLFRQDGKLMAETPAYDAETGKVEGMVTAEVTPEGLKNILSTPLPGGGKAPKVPGWQLRVFKDPHLVQRMIEAGKLLK